MKFSVWMSWALAFGALQACNTIDANGWKIERTRVLGAQVTAASDPTIASLSPGDSGSVAWIIAQPSSGAPQRPVAWAMAACVEEVNRGDTERCAGPVFFSTSNPASIERPIASITLPTEDSLAGAENVLVMGMFCDVGAPTIDPIAFTGACLAADGSAQGTANQDQTLASLELPIARDGENHNPAIAPDAVSFEGVPWGEEPDLEQRVDCPDSPNVPILPPGGADRTIRMAYRDQDREALPPPSTDREALQYSHFTTAGELKRQFSVLDSDMPLAPAEVAWTPPGAAEVNGELLVRFTFVLRDLRGGVAFTRRALCVRSSP